MGIYVLFLLFAYFVGVIILGLFVMSAVPACRVTMSGLTVFVLGAIGGTLALFGIWSFVARTFAFYKYIPVEHEGALTLLFTFMGTLLGGTALISLRTGLRSSHRRNQKP
jgi:hypothetical protein